MCDANVCVCVCVCVTYVMCASEEWSECVSCVCHVCLAGALRDVRHVPLPACLCRKLSGLNPTVPRVFKKKIRRPALADFYRLNLLKETVDYDTHSCDLSGLMQSWALPVFFNFFTSKN